MIVSDGSWLLNTRTSNSLLNIKGNNITLEMTPGAVLTTTLAPTGYCEMITIGPPLSQLVDPFAQTVYTLSGSYTTGVTSLTLATPANAGNFAAGDYVLIRTGQTIDGGVSNPDGELNKIVTADAGTGVLTLAWPTTKPYAQEYFVSGTSGVTSTSVTANLALYGVAKVTASTQTNIILKGLRFQPQSAGYWGLGGGVMVDRFELTDSYYDGATYQVGKGLGSPGRRRWSKISRNHATTAGTASATVYHYAVDTCVTDAEITDNVGVNQDGVSNLHLHEGAANVLATDNRLYSQATNADLNAISVRGRSYNATIKNNLVVNAGNTYAIYVDNSCVAGGIIADNTITGGNFTDAIAVAGQGWRVGPNNPQTGAVQFFEQTYGPTERLNNTVTPARQTAFLGVLPIYSFVIGVYLWVEEAFNGSVSNNISVGYAGSQTAIAPNQTVGATGRFVPAITAGLNRADRTLNAYYTPGGTQPTTGKVVVVVEYCRVRDAYS